MSRVPNQDPWKLSAWGILVAQNLIKLMVFSAVQDGFTGHLGAPLRPPPKPFQTHLKTILKVLSGVTGASGDPPNPFKTYYYCHTVVRPLHNYPKSSWNVFGLKTFWGDFFEVMRLDELYLPIGVPYLGIEKKGPTCEQKLTNLCFFFFVAVG